MRERPDIIASVVSWGDAVAGNARDILMEAESFPDTDGDGERQDAAEFLAEFLSDGPKSQKEVKEVAEANCHAWITIKRAKKDLGITSTKAGMKEGWRWALADGDHQTLKGLTPQRLSPFCNDDPLR
jgi:putative DNA primase/helicase